MIPRRYTVTVTTNGSGAVTARLPEHSDSRGATGLIAAILYAGGFDDGVTITVKTEKTQITVWSETLATDAAKQITGPSMPTHDNDGTERADAIDIPIAEEALEITIADGGNAKSADFTLVLLSVD